MFDADAVDEYLSREYRVDEEVGLEEFQEVTETLANAAYRKSAEWEAAVRQEKPVEEVDEIARDAAVIAVQLDNIAASYIHQTPPPRMSLAEGETHEKNKRAYDLIFRLGREKRHTFSPSEPSLGDFTLVNGGPIFEPDPEDIEETYTPPKDYISELSPTNFSVEIEVREDVSLGDIDGEGYLPEE